MFRVLIALLIVLFATSQVANAQYPPSTYYGSPIAALPYGQPFAGQVCPTCPQSFSPQSFAQSYYPRPIIEQRTFDAGVYANWQRPFRSEQYAPTFFSPPISYFSTPESIPTINIPQRRVVSLIIRLEN